jgi:hypothetical protein
MKKQVVTIHADGTLSGLQRKRGDGMDLRQFGPASIERASEILWIEKEQRWAIKILTGTYAGYMLTEQLANHHKVAPADPVSTISFTGWRDLFAFEEYDDAVKMEVAFLDAIRLQGHYT